MEIFIKAYSDSKNTFDFIPDEYKKDKSLLNCFVQGFFEHAGSIKFGNVLNPRIECVIRSSNVNIIRDIYESYDIKPSYIDLKLGVIIYEDVNAKDFLYQIYYKSDARYRDKRMHKKYIEIMTCENNKIPFCKFIKEIPEAIIPNKNRASDIGYSLTLIRKIKEISVKTAMYDTFIKVQPCFGYYIKIVPMNSLSESGYILSNSISIIDPNYTETLKIVLTKIDETLPDLKLPFKCCQLIIDKAIHYEMEEVLESEFIETEKSMCSDVFISNKKAFF
jgi:dUTPase